METMCPVSQEEDDWMEQQLDKARAERGGFYKRLTNSRSQSSRDLESAADKRRAAQSARDVSISSTSSSTPATTALPEPHSSWRFYTSYDNGEWKRHCVPVYKPEEEVVGKIKKSVETVKDEKETSPAYQSHLKKYREARANLFDHSPRTRISESQPREETNTVRVSSTGLHDDMGLYGGRGGGTYRYPSGGSNAQEMQMRTYGGENLLNGGMPLSFPKQNYREETSTKETITTVVGGNEGKMKQLMPAPAAGQEGTRRRSHNLLGYQEKIIIPTKYKPEGERLAIEASLAETSSRIAHEQSTVEKLKQKSASESSNPDHPSFMGSTFEKFHSDGSPLIKPSFEEPSTSTRSNSRRSLLREVERVELPQLPRIIPVFDEPPCYVNKPNTSLNNFSSASTAPSPANSFERTIVESRTFNSSPLTGSTPIIVNHNTEGAGHVSREVSVVSKPPIKPVFGELSTISRSLTMKETMPDIERSSLSSGIIHSEDSNVEAYFGNNFGALPAVTGFGIEGVGAFPTLPALPSGAGSRNIKVTSEKSGATPEINMVVVAPSSTRIEENVVFIPVIRVLGAPHRERHTSEICMNVNEGSAVALPTKGVTEGVHSDIGGQFENILKLHEDKLWIDSEIARHTPERLSQDHNIPPSFQNNSIKIVDISGQSSNEKSPSKLLQSSVSFGTKPTEQYVEEFETVTREKPVFPGVGNSTKEIFVSRNFGENEDAGRTGSIQVETTRFSTSEPQHAAVPSKTVEIDRRNQDGHPLEGVRYVSTTSSSVSAAAPVERIIEPRRSTCIEIKSVNTGQSARTRDVGGRAATSDIGISRTAIEVDDWIVEKAV